MTVSSASWGSTTETFHAPSGALAQVGDLLISKLEPEAPWHPDWLVALPNSQSRALRIRQLLKVVVALKPIGSPPSCVLIPRLTATPSARLMLVQGRERGATEHDSAAALKITSKHARTHQAIETVRDMT